MRITASDVTLLSQHEHAEARQVDERLRLWRGPEPQAVRLDAGGARNADDRRPSALLHLSAVAAQARPQDVPGRAVGRPRHEPQAVAAEGPRKAETGDGNAVEPRMQVLVRMVEAMTGIKVRVFRAEELQGEVPVAAVAEAASDVSAAASAQRAGWSMAYDRVEVRYEQETTVFAAQGTVTTADGRTIGFMAGLVMQREQLDVSQVSVRMGEAAKMKDPLVLNFDGGAPVLTDLRFAFDLDADGTAEHIPFVGPGSGFLVFDRNANGLADDGSELFGALSGNGFVELAAHDHDGNGWIDEADAIFRQLLVWQKDPQGRDRYSTLAEAGVGALYLGQTASPFTLKGGDNATLGQVRASGVYLSENGEAGVMQQIDLTV